MIQKKDNWESMHRKYHGYTKVKRAQLLALRQSSYNEGR